MKWLRKIDFLAPLTLLLMLTACVHDGKTVIAPEVESYLIGMVSWKDFSPPKYPLGPREEVMSKDECSGRWANGVCIEESQLDNAPYSCTTRKYTITDTPEKIVMYSPDVEILWPGALIQGKSHKNPGSLLGLIVRERMPIKVSIPALATEKNFRLVEHPDQAEVTQAIGSMIGDATMKNLRTPASITFKMRAYHSDEEFALSAGMSGKHLGFRASANADVKRTASEKTVAVHLYQKMYEVVVEPPQTPCHFFSADFTMEKLQEQIDLGKIHKTENIPVYVSNIVYGRMMMFTVTSTASEADIRAALNASYKSLTAEVKVDLDAKYKQMLDESKISITSLGGPPTATQAMIRTGNWNDYFEEDAPLSSAAPLSYTFRNLGDGSIAKVSESTTYTVTECRPASKDYILASFESGIENWTVPGAKRETKEQDKWMRMEGIPEWVVWREDSISENYIKAFESKIEDIYYFKAPIKGFLEFIDESWYGGELSYWLKTGSLDPRGKYFTHVTDIAESDHIILVGKNGVTLTYSPESFPEAKTSGGRKHTDWEKFSIPLRATKESPCWKLDDNCADEQTLKKVLSNVLDLRIRGEYYLYASYAALDEVEIAKPIAAKK